MDKLRQEDIETWSDICSDKMTSRRSNRQWAGIPTDQTIEQLLMRALKSRGGLAEKGQFDSELQRNIWLYSRNICAQVNDSMQDFVDYKSYTSEQHRDTKESRLPKNEDDIKAVLNFFKVRNPFQTQIDGIMNIVTGVVGDKTVNIHKANEVGLTIMNSIKHCLVVNHKFSRKDQAISLATKVVKKKNGTVIRIDHPQKLFMRLIAIASILKDDQVRSDLHQEVTTDAMMKHELCTYPPSLFLAEDVMLPATKPALITGIKKASNYAPIKLSKREHKAKGLIVIDGGGLLHNVVWEKNTSFQIILRNYVKYIKNNLATDHPTFVVFDSYPDNPTTKDSIHASRYPSSCLDVDIQPETILDIKKEIFLSNYKNKQAFVNKLKHCLEQSGILTRSAIDDADADVVSLAIEKLRSTDVTVYADDSDIIVLMLHNWAKIIESGHTLYYHSKSELWNINTAISKLSGHMFLNRILVVHAILGCDTTSRINGFGKDRLCKITDSNFWSWMDEFLKPGKNSEEIITFGQKVLLVLYNASNCSSLTEARLILFKKKNMKKMAPGDLKKNQQFADCKTLPPTDSAAKFHLLRVYHQVWSSNL